jgi:predicted nucleic acid-binding protein
VSLVLDTSVALGWYFEDERTPALDVLLDRVVETGAVAPVLWKLEIANGLQTAVRRKRIDAGFRDAAIAHLARLAIVIDMETGVHAWAATLGLADRFGLTAYDAAYLELAQRRALPLATLDNQLRTAGRALGLTLLGISKDN